MKKREEAASDRKIERLAFALMVLNEEDFRRVLVEVGNTVNAHKRNEMIKACAYGLLGEEERYKFIRVEQWMETRFTEDISRQARRVAYSAKKTHNIEGSVMHLLVPFAKTVKERVRKRLKRERLRRYEDG